MNKNGVSKNVKLFGMYCIWNTFQIVINHFYSNAYDLYGFLTSPFLYPAKLFVQDITYL